MTHLPADLNLQGKINFPLHETGICLQSSSSSSSSSNICDGTLNNKRQEVFLCPGREMVQQALAKGLLLVDCARVNTAFSGLANLINAARILGKNSASCISIYNWLKCLGKNWCYHLAVPWELEGKQENFFEDCTLHIDKLCIHQTFSHCCFYHVDNGLFRNIWSLWYSECCKSTKDSLKKRNTSAQNFSLPCLRRSLGGLFLHLAEGGLHVIGCLLHAGVAGGLGEALEAGAGGASLGGGSVVVHQVLQANRQMEDRRFVLSPELISFSFFSKSRSSKCRGACHSSQTAQNVHQVCESAQCPYFKDFDGL